MNKGLVIWVAMLMVHLTAAAAAYYDGIAITVNDRVITHNDIEIKALELSTGSGGVGTRSSDRDDLISQAENLLIEDALLDSRADELMIIVSEEELDEEVDHQLRRMQLRQAEFEELLDRQRTSLSEYRQRFRQKIQRERVISREIRAEIIISDDRLRALYEEGAADSYRVRARHILLKLPNNPSEQALVEVEDRLRRIREEVLAGASFEEMAVRHSEDPSVRQNRGDLGFFRKDDMVPEFAAVAFRLSPGTVSQPFRTPFGLHIIEIMERQQEAPISFNDVREKLYQQEFERLFIAKYEAYLADLRSKARIVYR
jgi:parvulin-like peptidyl-prolyl isomerase